MCENKFWKKVTEGKKDCDVRWRKLVSESFNMKAF